MNRKIKRFEAKCALIIKFRSLGKFNLLVWAGIARSPALTRLLFVSSQPSGKINFPLTTDHETTQVREEMVGVFTFLGKAF